MRIREPYNGEDLQWHPVTPSMSKISFQGPECSKPLKRKSITTFFQPKTAPGKSPTHERFYMQDLSQGLSESTRRADVAHGLMRLRCMIC